MPYAFNLTPCTVTELFSHIYSVGRMTYNDRKFLQYAILEDSLSPEDLNLIDRLLYAVRRGWVQITD